MAKRFLIALLLLGFVGPCLGTEPKARPAPIPPGVLDDLTELQWWTVPLQNGTRGSACVFSSAARQYVMLARPGNPPRVTIYALTPIDQPTPPPEPPGPGPGPEPPIPPVPPVPPPPTPATAEKVAYDAALKLPADTRAECAKMAELYRGLAKQIPTTIDDPAKLVDASRFAREIALGPARAKVWQTWAVAVGAWVNAEWAAKRLQSMADLKSVWESFAVGVEKAGKQP